jgi:MFS family permease
MTMGMLTQGWLVLTVTDSPFWVGAVMGARGIGVVAFGAFGGVLADRVDRRHILVAIHWARALSALLLGILTILDEITLLYILAIVFVQGIMQAFFIPANNALIYDTVGSERILNANAARMTGFNLSKIMGSIIVGVVIAAFGVGWAYVGVAIVWALTPIFILMVRVGMSDNSAQSEPIWQNLAAGIKYAFGRGGPIGSLLFLSLLVETFGFSYIVMLPVVARDVLGLGEIGFGLLSGASGVGALVGTMIVASLGDFRRIGLLLVITVGASGFGLLLFALSSWFYLSMIIIAFIGASLMAYDATMASSLQISVSSEMRGRIMGLYGLTFGFTPVGGFISGLVASALSVSFAIGLGGGIIVVCNLIAHRTFKGLERSR